MNVLLPGFEPSESDLVEIAMRMPLREKVEKALKLYRFHEPSDGYYLAFSGGKDSVVIKHLAERAGVKFDAWYNNVTIDPPELVRFIKREHSDVKWNNPKKHLCTRALEKKKLPTRLHRWCCQEYKEKGGDGRFKVIGVRAAESVKRKGMWKQVQLNSRGGKFLCPIVYWTDDDVWAYIRQNDIPYCKLYDEGFTRLGCIGCPMGNEKQRRMQFERYPRYEALWKRAAKRMWERYRHEITRRGTPRYFSRYDLWEEFWDWWVSGVKDDRGDDCQGTFMFAEYDDEDF